MIQGSLMEFIISALQPSLPVQKIPEDKLFNLKKDALSYANEAKGRFYNVRVMDGAGKVVKEIQDGQEFKGDKRVQPTSMQRSANPLTGSCF